MKLNKLLPLSLVLGCLGQNAIATNNSPLITNLDDSIQSTIWASDTSILKQTSHLVAPPAKTDGYTKHKNFAASMDVLDDILVVSGIAVDSLGTPISVVYVYKQVDGQWDKTDTVMIKKLANHERVGYTYAANPLTLLDKNTFVIGMPEETVQGLSRAGAAYIAERTESGMWMTKQLLSPVVSKDARFATHIEPHNDNQLFITSVNYSDEAPSEFIDVPSKTYIFERSAPRKWASKGAISLSKKEKNLFNPARQTSLYKNYLATVKSVEIAEDKPLELQLSIYKEGDKGWQLLNHSIIEKILAPNGILHIAMNDHLIAITGANQSVAYTTGDDWKTFSTTNLTPNETTGYFEDVAIHNDIIYLRDALNAIYIFSPYDNGKITTWVQNHSIKLDDQESETFIGRQLAFVNDDLLISGSNEVFTTGIIYSLKQRITTKSNISTSPDTVVNTSGLWYEPSFDGAGFNFTQLPQGFVANFYGHSQFGGPLWLISDVLPKTLTLGETVQVPLLTGYEGNGGNLFDKPTEGNGIKPWGDLYIQMSSCNQGVAVLDGVDGTKTLRLSKLAGITSIDCMPGNTSNAIEDDTGTSAESNTGQFAVSGTWYDPNYDGSGFVLTEANNGLVINFYGYQNLTNIMSICNDSGFMGIPLCVSDIVKANGKVNWLLSDVIPQTITKGQAYTATLFAPNQGTFTVAPEAGKSLTAWGKVTLTFSDCNSATAVITENYKAPNRLSPDISDEAKNLAKDTNYTVTHQLQRLATPTGLTCTE